MHPFVRRTLNFFEQHFENIVILDQDLFNSKETKILEDVLKIFDSKPEMKEKLQKQFKNLDSMGKWKVIQEEINLFKQERISQKGLQRKTTRRIKYAKEEIILTFLYPRLDVNVSNEINHLLKTPFSVHPKTAKICVPFRRKDLNTFNPLNVPTLRSLEDEVNKLGGEIDFKKTSFNKYYEEFDEFITKCEKNTQVYLSKQRKIHNIDSIDF